MLNSYKIKEMETIEQYKLMRWVNEHFKENTVHVEFGNSHDAQIIDENGDVMLICVTKDGTIKVVSTNGKRVAVINEFE